jgi:hypothetical protein
MTINKTKEGGTMRIKRLALLVSAALLALAVAANAASATVVDANGDPYDGTFDGTTSSATLSNGLISITCAGTFTGTITHDGTGTLPAPGGVTFQNCTPTATITINGLPYRFTLSGPNWTTLTFTTPVGATINAIGVFHCTASETAGDFSGTVNWSADTVTFNETLNMTGTGCGTTATWQAVYNFTPDLDWVPH